MPTFFFRQMLPNLKNDLSWQLGGSNYATVPDSIVAGHMLVTVAMYTILTGTMISIASRTSLMRFAKFMPFQVVGGFLAGLGLLACSGGAYLSSHIAGPSTLLAAVNEAIELGRPTPRLAQLALTCALVASMEVLNKRYGKKIPVTPLCFLAACAAFHGMRWHFLWDLDELFAHGWLTRRLLHASNGPSESIRVAFDTVVHTSFCPRAIFSPKNLMIWASMVLVRFLDVCYIPESVKFLGMTSTVDPTKEIFYEHINYACSGLCSGVPCGYHVQFLVLAKQLSLSTKYSTLVVIILLMTVGSHYPWILAYVPRFALAALLLKSGIFFVNEFLVESYKRIAPDEWKVLVSVATLVLCVDIPTAVFVGLVLSLIVCAREYNSVTGIVTEDSLGNTLSHVERSEEERQIIMQRGQCVRIFWLEGYLFFGSVSIIIEQIQQRLQSFGNHTAYLIIDFSRVPAIDASGVSAVIDMTNTPQTLQIQVVFAGMVRRLKNAVVREQRAQGNKKVLMFQNVDSALEFVEDTLIREEELPVTNSPRKKQLNDSSTPAATTEATVCAIVGDEELAGWLLSKGKILHNLQKGDQLWSEGNPVEVIALLLNGSLAITVGLPRAERPKPMDKRHLNLAKGDKYIKTNHTFKRNKWTRPAAIGVFEALAGMPLCLGTVEVDQSGTSVMLVPVSCIEQLRSKGGNPKLQAALQTWFSSALLKWATSENGKVRELIAKNHIALGDRHWSEGEDNC